MTNSIQPLDEENKNSTDVADKMSDRMKSGIEDWQNEHGQPSVEYLQSLVEDGSPEALEKLHAIAEDLDVPFDPETPIEELAARIQSATADAGNTTTE